ncbi:MAG: J domain-containing protein [Petrotogales bacterium]
MWDVYWFDRKYDFKNFNPNRVMGLIEDLKIDFKIDISDAKTFDKTKNIVFNLLQKVAYFGNVSNGKVPCSNIWKILFTSVVLENVKMNKDKSFFDLYYFFDNKDRWYKKKSGNEEHINKKKKDTTNFEEYITFMGLERGFNSKQLKRRYRILCLKYHPDKPGGSVEAFNRLQFVRRQLEKFL